MKIIGTVQAEVHATFNREEICRIVNQHFLGQDHINKWDETRRKLVEIDDLPAEVKVAHNQICSNLTFQIQADVTDTGRLINPRPS